LHSRAAILSGLAYLCIIFLKRVLYPRYASSSKKNKNVPS
jgi:hypothetical protein